MTPLDYVMLLGNVCQNSAGLFPQLLLLLVIVI